MPYPSDGHGYDAATEWKDVPGRVLNGHDTIGKLNALIIRNTGKMSRAMRRAWSAIAAEIRAEDISGETMPQKWVLAIRTEYEAVISEHLAPLWARSIVAGGRHIAKSNSKSIDPLTEAAAEDIAEGWAWGDNGIDELRDWLGDRAGELITTWGDTEISNIRDILHDAMMRGLVTPDKLAQRIRDTGIGLTRQQAGVQQRIFDALTEDGVDPVIIGKRQAWYRKKQLNHRARTIARTESAEAWNRGLHESVRSMERDGELEGEPWKRWWAEMSERTCPVCGALHNQRVPLDETFDGGLMHPTAHPSCVCTVTHYQKFPFE